MLIRTDLSFADVTTFGVGGKIKRVVYPESVAELQQAIDNAVCSKEKYVVLGCGSNVLASDDYYDGTVIITKRISCVTVSGLTVNATCGATCHTVAMALLRNNLAGGEFLYCLPATVGGAITMNAGCFGQEMKDVVCNVITNKGVVTAENCHFAKRSSVFQSNGEVVYGCTMRFKEGNAEKIRCEMNRMKQNKIKSQPLDKRSAGCVFYHEQVAVSRLIDQLGLKGYRIGGAEISQKHAGFVINLDKATSMDIYLLLQYIMGRLLSAYGIRPKVELQLIGYDEL